MFAATAATSFKECVDRQLQFMDIPVMLQVKFTFDELGLHLHYPAVYTICAQGLSNGSYVFPAAHGNVWLSARLQPDNEATS